MGRRGRKGIGAEPESLHGHKRDWRKIRDRVGRSASDRGSCSAMAPGSTRRCIRRDLTSTRYSVPRLLPAPALFREHLRPHTRELVGKVCAPRYPSDLRARTGTMIAHGFSRVAGFGVSARAARGHVVSRRSDAERDEWRVPSGRGSLGTPRRAYSRLQGGTVSAAGPWGSLNGLIKRELPTLYAPEASPRANLRRSSV